MTGLAGAAPTISLTTDVGEGFGMWTIADDDALLDIVTSANVACGFHAGDPDIMRHTCERAAHNGVAIGAQVSYRDLAGFGRRYVAVERETLTNDLIYQIGALETFARVAGTSVSYVRAHGALYNVAAKNTEHAAALVAAVTHYDPKLPLLCQVGTEAWRLAADAGLSTIAEAFVDRAYTSEGLLVPRTEPNAMLTNPREAADRAVRMVFSGELTALTGETVAVQAQSLLVHSDTAGAVEIASATRQALESAGARLVPQA